MSLRSHHKAESGVVLLAVLGIISLLVLLAAGVLEITRRHGQLSKRSLQASQTQELLDSAIRLAVRDLVSFERDAASGSGRRWTPTRVIDVFDQPVNVTLQLEAGRIDLNFADQDLLFALFAANQMSEATARALAASIIDWRDTDDTPLASGAERSEYRRVGRAFGPRNGPFKTIAEVALVLGAEQMPPALLDAVTVHAHATTVPQRVALPIVERALRWADARQLGGHPWLNHEPNGQTQEVSAQELAGQALRVQACLEASRQAACRVGIFRVTGSAQTPVQVLQWQRSYQ